MGRRNRGLIGSIIAAGTSWQKGQQYTRDAQLKEARTNTERRRQAQIDADIRYKDARTRLLNKMMDGAGGPAPAGVMLLGCTPCGIYDLNDINATHCQECGLPLTHEVIDFQG